jgi:hypothetical protein
MRFDQALSGFRRQRGAGARHVAVFHRMRSIASNPAAVKEMRITPGLPADGSPLPPMQTAALLVRRHALERFVIFRVDLDTEVQTAACRRVDLRL